MTRQTLGVAGLLLLCAGCEPAVEMGALSGCDLLYETQEWSWDEALPWSEEMPHDLLSRLSRERIEVAFPRDDVAAHPWVLDLKTWRIALAPHPKRPAVQVTSDHPACPEMVVLPVAVQASGGGGRILVEDAGMDDAPEWGADPAGDDLPWRLVTSTVRVYKEDLRVRLAIRPGPGETAEWTDDVQEAVRQATDTDLGGGAPTLWVAITLNSAGRHVSLSAHRPVGEGSLTTALAGGSSVGGVE